MKGCIWIFFWLIVISIAVELFYMFFWLIVLFGWVAGLLCLALVVKALVKQLKK